MAIKPSSAREIEALIGALHSSDEVEREAAVARLSVIGTRAVGRLIETLARATQAAVRLAVLRALEPTCDSRALEPALACLDEGDTAIAVHAVAVLRSLLRTEVGPRIIDRLTTIALDTARPAAVRLAALEALGDMPRRTLRPVWRQLRDDTVEKIRRAACVALGLEVPAPDPLAVLEQAATGALPDDPGVLDQALAAAAQPVPLLTLHQLVTLARAREDQVRDRRLAADWRRLRGTLHLALARRDSRVALYDLRESFERATEALPADYLSAMAAIGDRSCLDGLAAAYAHADPAAGGHEWWRERLAGVCRAIVEREKLTERHAAVRSLRSRWPEAAEALLGLPSRRRREPSRR